MVEENQMSKPCPICNFMLKQHEEVADGSHYNVQCHECGNYIIERDCAKEFRRKHLSFDVSTVGGRELYDHNIRAIRAYLVRHHKDVIDDDHINNIVGLYRPRQ